jgi:hypothetical protein
MYLTEISRGDQRIPKENGQDSAKEPGLVELY